MATKRTYPTEGHKTIIKEIGAIFREKDVNAKGVDIVENLLTNSKLNISYTIRETFPGSNGKAKHTGIAGGGQTHKNVYDCISSYFNGNENKIKKFTRYYYKASTNSNCVNRYVTGGSGIYPVNGPSARKDYVGNCTAYVYGRSLEIIEEAIGKNISNVNDFMPLNGASNGGDAFWENALEKRKGRAHTGNPYYWNLVEGKNATPEYLLPGTIICYSGCHVAVVEKVVKNKVYMSQSSYSSSGCREVGGYGFIFDYYSSNWSGGNSKLSAGSLNSGGYKVAGFIIPDWEKIKSKYGST